MKIKNVQVYGIKESIIRSGYPMQVGEPEDLEDFDYNTSKYGDIGYKRAIKLAKVPSGSGHDNFMKGIIVQFDLQYPEYFSPQLQRYSWIDIVSSQSKMHKITSRELTKNDFNSEVDYTTINQLNHKIKCYHATSIRQIEKEYFRYIINNLPSGYLKWMGISTNYLQLKTIYKQRRNHKLQEWQDFCNWIKTLPMSELMINE